MVKDLVRERARRVGKSCCQWFNGPRQLTCFCLFPCPAMTSNKPFEFLLYTKNWLHIFVVVCTYSVIDVTAWYSTSSRGPLFCSNHVVQHYICTSITIQTTGNLNLYLLNGALGEAFARGKPVSPTCYLFAWRHIVIQNMVWKLIWRLCSIILFTFMQICTRCTVIEHIVF